MKTLNRKLIVSLAIIPVLGISACNIDFSLDAATKDAILKTSTGVLSSLDSTTVNGINYDTSNAKIVVDGESTNTDNLKEGMVVSVTGVDNLDGTGSAKIIEFEDITEGEVLDNPSTVNNTLNVMGQLVHYDKATRFESRDSGIKSISDIDSRNIVEVSGFSSGDGEIWATRIEVKKVAIESGDRLELKGKIKNLTETTFTIGALTINYENAGLSGQFVNNLQEGLYVEVSSAQSLNDVGYFYANKIEVKNNGEMNVKYSSDDQEVEVKGVITEIVDSTEIKINGASIKFNNDIRIENGSENQLVIGKRVEAKGYIESNGQFRATKIEFESNERSDDRDDDGSDSRDGDNSDDREDDGSDSRDDDNSDDRDDDGSDSRDGDNSDDREDD